MEQRGPIAAKFEGMRHKENAWSRHPASAGNQNIPKSLIGGPNAAVPRRQEAPAHSIKMNASAPNNTNQPSMANRVVEGVAASKNNEPFVLQPDKIKKIGCVGLREGRPSLYFLGEDTHFLAEKMGHAVVGKFSHSIPSTNQVQKMLGNIKFTKGFKWNYINAKHLIIQFDDIEDYAKMLNGPSGTPVWYADHHQMRVFKWTPDLDSFFETPINVVWCNVIAVPIHIFEVSALYAIDSLLGNPIQLDHDTANRKRLSFARICVEIDISKPPTEEIVLEILGKRRF